MLPTAKKVRWRKKLVTHVLETLQESPGVHRIEAQLLLHETGRVAGPFLHQGFQRYPRLFMELALPGRVAPAKTSAAKACSFELRRWQESDYQHAAALITACYRGHIDSQINDQYRTVQGALRFLNNIVRFPGCGVFDANSSFVAIDRATRAPVGLILCSRVKDNIGHVTQVCVLPEHRGKKIGLALLEASAEELRKRSFKTLSLTVTEANERAVDLYRQLGFSVARVFDAFVWEG